MQAEDDNYAGIDKEFKTKTKGKGFKFLKANSTPGINHKTGKMLKEMDTIETCNIMYLKCTGSTGPVKLQASPIDQARLFVPSRQRINCSTTLDNINGRGDPGSIFTFTCPKDCALGGELVGAGLYASKSSICKAAVQQNMLSNSDDGIVSVVIGYPTLDLTAGENSENIMSSVWPDPTVSDPEAVKTFAVVQTNLC